MTLPRPGDLWLGFGVHTPGSDDGIAHAGRHYLSRRECWEDILPSRLSDSSPPVLRAFIDATCDRVSVQARPWGEGEGPGGPSRNPRWWSDPFRLALDDALRAYVAVFVRAVGRQGSGLPSWRTDRRMPDRCLGVLDGGVYAVVVDEGVREWVTITAFRPLPPIRLPDRASRRSEAVAGARRRLAWHASAVRLSEPAPADVPTPRDATVRPPRKLMTMTTHDDVQTRLDEITAQVHQALRDDVLSAATAAFFLLTVARAERLARGHAPGDDSFEASLAAAVDLRAERRIQIAHAAIDALLPRSPLPASDGELAVREMELMEHLQDSDTYALLAPSLPTGAARRLRQALEETVALLSLEPALFAPVSGLARAFMDEEGLHPGDPAWELWSLAVQAAAAAAAPAVDLGLDREALLRQAWEQGSPKRSSVLEALRAWGSDLAAGLKPLLDLARSQVLTVGTAVQDIEADAMAPVPIGPNAALGFELYGQVVVLVWEEVDPPAFLEALLDDGSAVRLEPDPRRTGEGRAAWRWPTTLDPERVISIRVVEA